MGGDFIIKHKYLVLTKVLLKTYILYIAIYCILYLLLKSYVHIDRLAISDVMKSTLTVSSILLGFFGTLLAQIINLKSKYSNDTSSSINVFFNNVSNYEIKIVLITNVLNSVIIDVISLLILIQGENVGNNYLRIWSVIFVIFILHQCYVYYIFIELLLMKEKCSGTHGKLTTEQETKFNEKISKNTLEQNAFKINNRTKRND